MPRRFARAASALVVLVLAAATLGRHAGLLEAPPWAFVVLAALGVMALGVLTLAPRGARAMEQAARARLASLVRSSQDAILAMDLDGIVMDWNPAAERIYGYSASEMLGKSIRVIVPPERADEMASLLERTRRGERVEPLETLRRRRDGSLLPVYLTFSPIVDAAGRIIGASTIAHDISARKEVEAALQRSEEKFRQLFEQASDGIFIADLDGRYTDVNGAGCRLLGATREEIVGKTIVDLIPPEDVPRLWAAKELLLTGGVQVAEWLLRHKDGTFIPVEVSAKILPGGRWQGFVRDIRARRAAEERLRNLYEIEALERAWLEAVIEQMPEGVVLMDARGRVTAQNRSLLALSCGDTGERDPFGNPVLLDARRPSGERLPAVELPGVRALRGGERTTGLELVLRRRDGTLVPVLVSAAPVRGAGGEIMGATMVVQDISPLKDLERLREEWAAVIAHDLRQPVNIIALSSDLLSQTCGECVAVRSLKTLERIRVSTRRLKEMINDLLDTSLIEARRLTVDRRAVDLPALVEEIIERMAGVTSGHDVRVTRRGELAPVWADTGRIEQVLGNLLSNAVKYGEPEAEIQVDLEGRAGEVEVTVTNRGQGIPPDELGRLFSRFARGRERRAPGTVGLGLGLYICKGLVEAHGGRIWVESTPGATTRFHFTLPLAPPGAPLEGEAHPTSPPAWQDEQELR